MVIYLATQIGFSTSWMNPFSIIIAQGIAELPILSGSLFRNNHMVYIYIIDNIFTVFYALKIQKKPQSSPSISMITFIETQMNIVLSKLKICVSIHG